MESILEVKDLQKNDGDLPPSKASPIKTNLSKRKEENEHNQ